MSLAVVGYPTMSDGDREWMEGVRAQYDPLASRIAAHVTLVFPTRVAVSRLVPHVREIVQPRAPFPVVIGRAITYRDPLGSGAHVFLVVEQGHDELVTLQEAMYGGVLASHQRPDTPFVPHVTVGAHPRVEECERIASRINEEGRIVQGWIDRVSVIEIGESMIRTVAEIPLGSGRHQPPNRTTGGSWCSPTGRSG